MQCQWCLPNLGATPINYPKVLQSLASGKWETSIHLSWGPDADSEIEFSEQDDCEEGPLGLMRRDTRERDT